MHKIALIAAVILAGGVATWLGTPSLARVEAAASAQRINPSQMTTKNQTVEHFDDYSFVFN
jgi:hypothetical protein